MEETKIQLIKRTFEEWQTDKASRLAAALAFYAVLSIPPLLVLLSTLVGQFAGEERVRQAIIRQAERWLAGGGAEAIQAILDAATQPINFSLAALLSLAILLFSASGVFVQLQDAMNTVWNVMPDPEKGIWNTVQKRAISFAMVLAAGVLFILLLLVSSMVAFLGNVIQRALPGSLPVIQILNIGLGAVILSLVFALIYKTLPDVEIDWRDVGMGAAVTTGLFLLGVLGLGVYFRYSDVTSSYGAAGSLIVLMLFIYYSAQVFFLGAEFTQVYANLHGSPIRPEEGAVHVERVIQTSSEETGSDTPNRKRVE